MDTSQILDRLDDVRSTGEGKWMACCPAHNDRRASLSISRGEDGRTLLRCHAGCDVDAILDALGLKASDLFASNGRGGFGYGDKPNGNGRPLRWDSTIGGRSTGSSTNGSLNGKPKGRGYSTAKSALAALERKHGKRSGLWKYFDASGEPVGVVVRWDTNEGKDVRPISRIGDKWHVKAMETPRPLYGLTGLPDAGPILIPEGEKTADAATSIGFAAVTSSGGSSAASKSDWTPLRGREVILSPDADDSGEKYVEDAAAILRPIASSIKVLRLPGLKPGSGEDLVDWLARGGDADQLRRLVAAAPEFDQHQAADKPTPAPTLKWKPYPLDEHPEPIRTYVRRSADSIGCDPAFVATAILPALASSIGTSRVVLLKPGWDEPSVLWGALVGDSGDGKSPAIDAATKHLRRRQAKAIEAYRREREEYDREQEFYELTYSDWKRSGRKKGDPPPIEPVAPKCERVTVSDSTIEGLTALLANHPRGLLLNRDELSGWLASFDRYSGNGKSGPSGDAAHWLSIHGSRDLLVDRKTGDRKTIYVRRAAVSVVGGIQPGILARSLAGEHTESGLAARLIAAMPPRRVKRWNETGVDEELDRQVGRVFDRLLALEPQLDEDGQEQPVVVGLSTAAKAVWVDFYNRHAERQADASGSEAAVLAKIEATAARLSLIRYLVRQAAGEAVGGSIEEQDVVAAVRLAEWYADEAIRVGKVLSESDEDRLRRHVVEFIRRRGGSITANELRRRSRQFKTSEEAEKLLDSLFRSGVGVWETPDHGDAGGRPTRVFRLSDSVSVSETPKTATPGGVSDTGGAESARSDGHDQDEQPDGSGGHVSETPAKPERNRVWDTDTGDAPANQTFEEIRI